MIETRKKKSKKSMEETFPVVAARHPELQGVSAERKDEVWTALMRKLPMPFEQFQGPQAWLREPVWEQEAYDSALKNEKCCDATYESLKLTRDLMRWTTFKQFHDCYLHMDCLAPLDMLSALRSEFFGFFHLDLVQYVTLPGASWHALLRSLKQPISLPETAEVYSTLRKGIMGGLTFSNVRCANGTAAFHQAALQECERAERLHQRSFSLVAIERELLQQQDGLEQKGAQPPPRAGRWGKVLLGGVAGKGGAQESPKTPKAQLPSRKAKGAVPSAGCRKVPGFHLLLMFSVPLYLSNSAATH